MDMIEQDLRRRLGLRDDEPLPDLAINDDIGPLPIGKLEPNGPFGSKSLGPDFGPFTGNVYFHWFEYMKEYPAYLDALNPPSFARNRQAMREFDIKADEDFSSWWGRKSIDLFYDLYEDESRALEVANDGMKRDLGDGLLVHLPIDGNISDMLDEIEQMFKSKRKALRGKYPELFRKYALHQGRYTVLALHNKLQIYRAFMVHSTAIQEQKLRLYDLFFAIADRLIISRGYRNVNNEAASRMMSEGFEQACRLLYNVGEGRFPDYSKPSQRYLPR